MRILLSNDDGISAPGLVALENIARKISKDIWIAAPESEQSGAGHSLTLHVPVRVREISARRHAISGTPTDCVLLALHEIIKNPSPLVGEGRVGGKLQQKKMRRGSPLPNPPPQGGREKKVDLLLSGVNRGSNVGDDVTYSGTIAAAMEGTMLGVPSIAFSQLYDDREDVPWDVAEHFAPGLIKKLVKAGWPDNTLINVNFPNCAIAKVKGVRVCPQGKRLVNVALSERIDPKGRPYYWIGGERDNASDSAESDIAMLEDGYITVTPICLDLTDYKTMEAIRTAVGK